VVSTKFAVSVFIAPFFACPCLNVEEVGACRQRGRNAGDQADHGREQRGKRQDAARHSRESRLATLNLHDPNGNVRDRVTVPIPLPSPGVGVVSAFGDSADAFRTALLEGRTGIAPAP
jgi:hypothetical protein